MLAYVIGVKIIVQRRKRSKSLAEMEEMSWNRKKEGSSSLPSHLCRYFTIAEIRKATNNFDDVFIIGVGGFGNVYKGYIDEGTPVAIKRLKPGSQQGVNEFMNEIELLSQLRHIHLVSLIGYCYEGAEMILVYDFMQRGTLSEYLYGSDNEPLTWKHRLEILLGAARGLNYLHEGAKHNIIHRDVKSTNILLDEKWVAKVSDFGLSKVGPSGMSMTHVTTIVKGSLGYLDPEYYMRQRLTLKSDVYSFGVVLLEVLCARPPLVRSLDKKKASLVVWFQRCYNEGVIIEEMVDSFIKDSITDECLKCYCQMALGCLHDDGNQRLSMSDVVGALEFALQLSMSDEDSKFGEFQEKEKSEQFMIDDGSDMQFTSSGDDYESHTSKVSSISATTEDQPLFSATIFSENGNPIAR
jgi:serine/threonine protein kinase